MAGFVWYQQQKMAMAARAAESSNSKTAGKQKMDPDAALGHAVDLNHRLRPRSGLETSQ